MKTALYATLVAALLAVAGCTTDNNYDGCHGVGCMVDDPELEDRTIDDRPQFDREGNPNFDEHGNYQGCHGIGCQVDDPDDYSG
ncbi:MAG: hypothetical protein ABL311_16345 [Nitratireductor rhodophyticola]|uniref:hypothetical protein n=1 Tax=Nitratireductor rhodophyticola TaxID=2854036 RepID=UPI0032D96A5E